MTANMRLMIAAAALTCTFAGVGQSAYALGKHTPKPPKVHQGKKNGSLYDYLGPQKQKKQKGQSGTYRSPVSGNMLYGKKK